MENEEVNIQEEIKKLTSSSSFEKKYYRILKELDALDSGTFDDTEAKNFAALCLRAQTALVKSHAAAEAKGKGLKRAVEFEKAVVYTDLKKNPPKEYGKMTEATLAMVVNKDEGVDKLIKEQIEAEKEAREYSHLLSVLTNAHVTFRTLIKKGE